jgi:xylan 1,4-beta-xylosidase
MTTSITINIHQPGQTYYPLWKKLITAGRAAEGLREDWREQLREVQREIPFEYIRFHGVLHDDMMIYHEDAAGRPNYNWQYFDSLVDFLQEVRLRPILELSFMPTALKSGEATVFWWKGNITPPKDEAKWTGLVRALVIHCLDRYGPEEVLQWYFEVWNEPNLYQIFWDASQDEYFTLYEATARAIKDVHPGLRVGGPATSDASAGEAPWMLDFLSFCERKQAPLDFVSTHPYPNHWPKDESGRQLLGYRDPDSTLHDLQWLRRTLDASPYRGVEIHLTEWNASPDPRDLVHDTAFMAPFVIQNHIQCLGLVDSLGFWTFSDVFEEGGAGDTLFHGGFGLINLQGLKKASYFGYWFLARLGPEILAMGEDYLITRRGQDVQVLLWNYCHYTEVFAAGDRSRLSLHDRYGVFAERDRAFAVCLGGLEGAYQITLWAFDRDQGSAFDAWLRNGALASPTSEDLNIIRQGVGPVGSISLLQGQAAYTREVTLAPHGVLLIELKRRWA